jgi:hypothetical protein
MDKLEIYYKLAKLTRRSFPVQSEKIAVTPTYQKKKFKHPQNIPEKHGGNVRSEVGQFFFI